MSKLDFKTYCQFVAFTCCLAGIMLFFYCFFMTIPIWQLHDTSNPLLYLGLGLMFWIIFLMKKYENKIKGVKE